MGLGGRIRVRAPGGGAEILPGKNQSCRAVFNPACFRALSESRREDLQRHVAALQFLLRVAMQVRCKGPKSTSGAGSGQLGGGRKTGLDPGFEPIFSRTGELRLRASGRKEFLRRIAAV